MEQQEEKCFHHHGKLKMVVVLVLVLGVVGLGALSILRDKIMQNNDYQFSVSAEGKVTAKPDIANLSFGFQTGTKANVADAVKEGNDKMNAIIAELTKLKISKDDIKTTQYSLNPVYSYEKDTGIRRSGGYELNQSIGVKVRDLNVIGDVIQKAVAAGANQTGDVNFTIDDSDKLKVEARAQAIKKAQEKAVEISRQSGIKLGKLVNVMESGFYEPVYSNNFAYAKDASGMGGNSAPAVPDIQSGNMEIKVTMTLNYKVK